MKIQNNFAVLVLNYNGKRFLKDCFHSIKKQNMPCDIWLIDNASTDSSIEFTRKNFPQVRILQIHKNLGFCGGYNFADSYFKKNSLDYTTYLFLNNDTKIDSNVVADMNNILQSDSTVGIAFPTILNNNLDISIGGGQFLFLSGTTLGFQSSHKYEKSHKRYSCFWASGCALAIRVSDFRKLGRFQKYFAFFEDVDISWKTRLGGKKVICSRNSSVIHYEGGTATSALSLYYNERNRVISYWQNLPSSLFFFILPVFILIRLFLMGYLVHDIQTFRAKFKGLWDGLTQFHEYRKSRMTFLNSLKVIATMYAVRDYMTSTETFLVFTHVAYQNKNEVFGVAHQLIDTILKLGYNAHVVKHSLYDSRNILIKSLAETIDNIRVIHKHTAPVDIIAVDPLNYFGAYIGSILFPWKVKRRIFFTIDYTDTRFESIFANWIYHFLDWFAIHTSDAVWSVSSRIVHKRQEMGLHKSKNILLPNSPSIDDFPLKQYNGNQNIIIVAVLNESVYIQPLLESIHVLKKQYPRIHLSIIGSGPAERKLKNVVKKEKLQKYVTFFGLRDHVWTVKKMTESFIGVALYTQVNTWNHYGDSLKAREYAASSIPTIINTVPSTSDDIKKYNAGLVMDVIDSTQITQFIRRCIDQPKYYEQLRNNSRRLAEDFDKLKLLKSLLQ